MNKNSADAGYFRKNSFNCQQFHFGELRSIRGGRAIVSFDSTSPGRPYVITMKAMQFNEYFLALPMEIFKTTILVFSLTSLQDAAEQLPYPELSGESLRFEMFFLFALEQVTELIILRENYQIFKLIILEESLKWLIIFEFSSYYKSFVMFLGLSIVIVSVLLILFFFRAKTPEKVENECCFIEKPRHFFNLDCKTVFNILCPLDKTCVWDFVDSILKCVSLS